MYRGTSASREARPLEADLARPEHFPGHFSQILPLSMRSWTFSPGRLLVNLRLLMLATSTWGLSLSVSAILFRLNCSRCARPRGNAAQRWRVVDALHLGDFPQPGKHKRLFACVRCKRRSRGLPSDQLPLRKVRDSENSNLYQKRLLWNGKHMSDLIHARLTRIYR